MAEDQIEIVDAHENNLKHFLRAFGSMKILHDDIGAEYSKTGLYPLRR